MWTKSEQKANKKRTQCEQNVNIRFGTRASALVTSFSKIIAKRCHAILKVGAPRRAISVIFYAFVESGKQHLDCAGAVGLGLRDPPKCSTPQPRNRNSDSGTPPLPRALRDPPKYSTPQPRNRNSDSGTPPPPGALQNLPKCSTPQPRNRNSTCSFSAMLTPLSCCASPLHKPSHIWIQCAFNLLQGRSLGQCDWEASCSEFSKLPWPTRLPHADGNHHRHLHRKGKTQSSHHRWLPLWGTCHCHSHHLSRKDHCYM